MTALFCAAAITGVAGKSRLFISVYAITLKVCRLAAGNGPVFGGKPKPIDLHAVTRGIAVPWE
jgi:hypothetical protein